MCPILSMDIAKLLHDQNRKILELLDFVSVVIVY